MKRSIPSATRPLIGTLDPFCGSGTTLCAAASHGRHFIGIDIFNEREENSGKTIPDLVADRCQKVMDDSPLLNMKGLEMDEIEVFYAPPEKATDNYHENEQTQMF